MGLFIPTSGPSENRIAHAVEKGFLVNLDTNESLSFQFNPERQGWEREINWEDITRFGDDTGGDLHFINRSPREMSLPLLFLADPGAPRIEYAVKGNPPGGLVVPDPIDFEFIEKLIDRWTLKLPGKGRPAAVGVFLGKYRSFYGVITNVAPLVNEWFKDLSAKEALLTLELKEWSLAQQLQ